MGESLLDAYHRTTFVADTPGGRLRIRIGRRCPDLDSLLAQAGVHTWAYVTAFNPGSRMLTAEESQARSQRLERVITELAYRSFPGEGIGDDGKWPPEPSLLILGINRDDARRLGRDFEQVAIVVGAMGCPAELLTCSDDCSGVCRPKSS